MLLVVFLIHLYELIHALVDGFLFLSDLFIHGYFPFRGIFTPDLRATFKAIALA